MIYSGFTLLLALLVLVAWVAMTVSLITFVDGFRIRRTALRRLALLERYVDGYEYRILKLQKSASDYFLSLGNAGVISLAHIRSDLEKARLFAAEVRELLIERGQTLTAYYLLRDNVSFARKKFRTSNGKFSRIELSNWQLELEHNIQRLGQMIVQVVATAAENDVRANALKAFAHLSDAGIEDIEPLRELIMSRGGSWNFFLDMRLSHDGSRSFF